MVKEIKIFKWLKLELTNQVFGIGLYSIFHKKERMISYTLHLICMSINVIIPLRKHKIISALIVSNNKCKLGNLYYNMKFDDYFVFNKVYTKNRTSFSEWTNCINVPNWGYLVTNDIATKFYYDDEVWIGLENTEIRGYLLNDTFYVTSIVD